MSLIAITRAVSPNINRCELSFHNRVPIDVAKAIGQHAAYQKCLEELGAEIVALPALPDLPDSVFVEDAAIIVEELAVIPVMGAPSRRPEPQSLAETISKYRPIKRLTGPAALDGGDVLRVGRELFVGLTKRTNRDGIMQLKSLLKPHGYAVKPVEVMSVLHLKSACSYIGNNTLLINRPFLRPDAFADFDLIDVPPDEPRAANVLLVNDTLIVPSSFPKTRALLQDRGYRVRGIDVTELQKAEAGVTCCSLIFNHEGL
jgi:dimethylargininase